MNNFGYTKKLIKNRNAILNHFAEKSPHFQFNFLNRESKVGKITVGSREQWSGCHAVVKYYQKDEKGWNRYDDAKAYYITFNAYNDYKKQKPELGDLSVSLRADLVEYWAGTDVSNCYVLFVSNLNDFIYEMPVKNIISYALKHKDKCGRCYNGFRDYIIPVCNETVVYEAKQNSTELLPMDYNPDYYKPEYIANFTYSVYRTSVAIKVGMFSATGKLISERVFRSISELYDKIKPLYNKSKKTLQRQIAREEAIKLTNGMMIIISSDLDKDFSDADYQFNEVVDTWIENALFIEEQPEGASNPRMLPVKSHYEPVKKLREDWEEHLADCQETEYYDDEEEMAKRDLLEKVGSTDVKEKQAAYLELLQKMAEQSMMKE